MTPIDKIRAPIQDIITDKGTREQKLMRVCEFLHTEVPVFDWVGFYLADPQKEKNLILGPFVGEPTDHTEIGYGVGICGQSADTLHTFVVQDVNKESNYLSCSPTVQSEIVVPIIKDGTFVAQLDIDSHTLAPFSKKHQSVLEEVCQDLVAIF